MFQGSATNLKTWNEYTKSKFLDKLKDLGSVYIYQDKTYNIWYYNKTDPEHIDFDSDIDIDLSYVDPKTHIKLLYNDIQSKYKNLQDYKFIPIGWSAGCYLALYFAQLYSSQCLHVILLDSALWTPNNMKARLKELDNGLYPITNAKYKKMLLDWKNNNTNIEDAYKINSLNNYIRSIFFSKYLNLELPVPTLSFVNIQDPEGKEWSKDFNNKRRLNEVKILEKKNPDNYKAIIMTNKTHYIFNKIQPAKLIIKQIKNILSENILTKIKLTEDNTKIIKIEQNSKLKKYKNILIELTKVCEPSDEFNPDIEEPYEIFWIAKYKNEIIGYIKSTNLDLYKDESNFRLLGGIKKKKGIQISGACNGTPDKYSNLATLLLFEIENYARNNNFEYILLHAGTDRGYLIDDNPARNGLYIKNGYKKIRILKAGEGRFSDIDLWIMHKLL